MQIASGTIVKGKVVLDGATFPDGTKVTVVADDPGTFQPTPEEEVVIREGLAQAQRGQFLSVRELFARLR